MPRHIRRLLLLMAVAVVAALGAKSYFTKDSFYRFGHYRADSVPQIAAMATSFQTSKTCVTCHSLRHEEWSGQVHKVVICEVCHGATPGHPGPGTVSIPAEAERLCTQCHEKMPGRPLTSIRQVGPDHHPGASCIACHNPHAPKIPTGGIMAVADTHTGLVRAGATASAPCAACHGPDGHSVNPDWPNLAGQSETYIVRALAALRVGERKSEVMGPMAQALTDADVRSLAAFFSSQRCAAGAGHLSGADLEAARGQARACATCHGEGGRGTTNASLPRLAGQNASYLAASLKGFASGQRPGPIMQAALKGLTESDLDRLATYYASQSCVAPIR